MKSRKLFVLACLMLLALATPSVFAERLPIKLYTSADGLGSGFVDSLFRDSRGLMWFCTRNGLSRFDGSQFITYHVGESLSPGIETIYETRNGDYWVSTTSGTYRFNPNESAMFQKNAHDLSGELVTGDRGSFFEDSRGTLWMMSGTVLKLEIIDGKREFVQSDWKIPQRAGTGLNTYQMSEGEDGSLWVFSSWGLTRRLPDGRFVHYRFDQKIYGGVGAVSFMIDKSGRVWISLLNDIYVVKPEPIAAIAEQDPVILRDLRAESLKTLEEGDTVPYPKLGGEIVEFHLGATETNSYRRLFQSSDGDVWISAGNRLYQVTNGLLRMHTSEEGLPEGMSRMEEDAAGNLWIGGTSALARLDRNGIVTFDKSDGANSSRFASVSEGPDGSLYFANSDTYVSKLEGTKLVTARPDLPIELPHLWMSRFVKVASDGDIWLLSGGKLYRYSGIKNIRDLNGRAATRTYGVADGLKSDGMFQIFEDSAGDIWMSTRGQNDLDHGVARLKKGTERFESFTEVDGLPPRRSVSSFAETRDGAIWMTFYEGGLAKFDGDQFTYFAPGDKLPEGLLSDIHVDHKGRIWLSSAITGLIRIDDPNSRELNVKVITTQNGLSSNNIRTLTEDRFGRLYLGTASGVDSYSPETGHVKHYSVNDGLAADFVVDSMMDRDGNIWFVTPRGVSRLVPRYDDTVVVPKVFIGGVRINGVDQAVSTLGSVSIEHEDLGHNESNIEVEFFGIDFRAGESLRYQYKLEGADSDWSQPTTQRIVNFGNLSPATYRFMVRAINSEDVPSDVPAVFSFRILPPIWARWWFVALAVVLLAGLIYGIISYRTARLREVNSALEEARLAEERLRISREERLAELEQVRSRIATDLHDDIGASLTQIAILSEVAQTRSKNGATEQLRMITDVSNELVGTMSDIVWSINPAKDHFSDLTQRMRRFASDLLSSKGIGLEFQTTHEDDELTLNSNIRRELFLTFKEAVNNLVKHSEATTAVIAIGIAGSKLSLEISDNGKGFDPTATDDAGNGLASMRRRISEMKGSIEIGPRAGGGTRVKVLLPIGKTDEAVTA